MFKFDLTDQIVSESCLEQHVDLISPADIYTYWMNRAFCGKSMKFGTDVLWGNTKKIRTRAKLNFACDGHGGHL